MYIRKYKDELLRGTEGEEKSGRKNFTTVSGLLLYTEKVPETTQALGILYPIIFRENTNEIKAEFLYEIPEYKKHLTGTREFYELGLWKPEIEYGETLGVIFWRCGNGDNNRVKTAG